MMKKSTKHPSKTKKRLSYSLSSMMTRYLIVLAIMIGVISVFASSCQVFAADSSSIVETTFFGNLQDDGEGCGVFRVLNLTVDILSIGIGILGVVGITIVGIQYLTAGGNEQQTVKAKRRMFEIVIGLVAYAALYAFSQWILPGGKLNTNACQTVTNDQLASIRAKEQAAKQAARQAAQQAAKNKSNNSKKTVSAAGLTLSSQIAKMYTPEKMAKQINKGKIAPDPVCTNCTWGERIAQTAELLAWPGKQRKKWEHHYDSTSGFKKWSDLGVARPNPAFISAIDHVWPSHGFSTLTRIGADCGTFVNVTLAYSGHDPKKAKNKDIRNKYGSYFGAKSQKKKWQKVTGQPKRGDVCFKNWSDASGNSRFHTRIYLGKKNGKNKSAEAGYHSKRFGHIITGGCEGYQVYRAI